MAGNAYNPGLIFFLMDSQRIQGAGPDAFVEIEELGNSEVTIGLDGGSAITVNPTKAKRLTLSLLVTGEGYKIMSDFVAEDRRNGGLGSVCRTLTYSDASTGHRLVEREAVIVEAPFPGAGRTTAVATFVVFLPNPDEERPLPASL